MVSDLSTSFISAALKSRRADSPGPSVPARSKYPTPCLYSTTVRTGNSAPGIKIAQSVKTTRLLVCMSSPTVGWTVKSHAEFPSAGALLTHHFNDDAFRPLAVELGVINLLPSSEIQFRVRDGNDDLVMHDQTFEVRIAIGFTRAM